MSDQYCLPFTRIGGDEHDLVGGKCASLGAMMQAGVAVPPGFAVTTTAQKVFMKDADINAKISMYLAKLDANDNANIVAVGSAIRALIINAEIPQEVEADIRTSYEALGEEIPVAVRSSATAEDLPDASFAGQQDTYLWVVGADEVVRMVRSCWGSLFADRAIKYRADNDIPQESVFMSVAVQKMVNSRSAGVAMTLNPTNGDRTKISIDASWGLGETVVSGEVTPDNFLVDKVLLSVVDRKIADKLEELVPEPENKHAVMRKVDAERRNKASVSDEEVIAIAELAKRLEKLNNSPQDVEWAIDSDLPKGKNLFALQSRPETVWARKFKQKKNPSNMATGLQGIVGALIAPANAAKKVAEDTKK